MSKTVGATSGFAGRASRQSGVRRPVATTVRIKVDYLRAEMAARGITGRELAKEAGISEGTIYNALHDRPILLRNAKLIAGALERIEIDPTLGRLLLPADRRGAA